MQLKPALGGNVVAPILSKTLPNLVTLRPPGVLTPAAPESGARSVRMDPITPTSQSGADVTLLSEHLSEEHGALELTSAEVVVGVGMGVTEEGVATAQQLAASIGASICTTRNVVHSGWLPHHVQVGISGRTIAPQVYLAVGIRGAFNHTVGIQKGRRDSRHQPQPPRRHLPRRRLRHRRRLERVPAGGGGCHQAGAGGAWVGVTQRRARAGRAERML